MLTQRYFIQSVSMAALFCGVLTARAVEKEDGNPVEGQTAFALEMYQELIKTTDENLFFSPYSISSALGMTYVGARGNTADEMRKALHFSGDSQQVARSFGVLQTDLNTIQQGGDVQLSIANGIWAEKNYSFLPDFLDRVQNQYRAKLSSADFKTNAEGEREVINTWVEEQTNEKIKDLIPSGVLNKNTRMVLANAIYFKGDWASQFEKRSTREGDFYITADQKVSTPMMFQNRKFGLSGDRDTQVLELPYKGDRLSMVVLLPREKDGLSDLEASLSVEKLNGLVAKIRPVKVQVTLPKFRVESASKLNKPLKKMGMKDAFSTEADFSGIDGTKNLNISAVLHKAFVEVDEEGTEAAAATAVVIKARTASMPPRFKADHPFIFLIRDKVTGTILFMGKIVNPVAL